MRRSIRAIRAIWDSWQNGTKLDFKGQFYRFDLMTPFFNPGPIEHPKIPIYIAGVNPLMCRVAGELCDGLHVHPFNSPKYLREVVHPAVEEGLPEVRARPRRTSRTPRRRFVVVGDTREGAGRAGADRSSSRSPSTAPRAPTSPCSPRTAGRTSSPQLHRKSVEGDWKGMADLITDEMLDTYAVTAHLRQARATRSSERYDGLLDRTGALPALSAQPRRPAPARGDPRLQFVSESTF